MDLRHPPIVEQLAAAHGVAEVRAPIVTRIDICHRRGDPAFRHHRMRFSKQGLANDSNAGSISQRFSGGAQSGPARAND